MFIKKKIKRYINFWIYTEYYFSFNQNFFTLNEHCFEFDNNSVTTGIEKIKTIVA